MGNYLWFDSRQVIAGTSDLKASGKELVDEFKKLEAAAARLSALESTKPAGTDETGKEFDGWYLKFKAAVLAQGKDVGEAIVELGTNAEQALAVFTRTDLESAEDMKPDKIDTKLENLD